MKKQLAALFAAILAAGILMACGSSDKEPAMYIQPAELTEQEQKIADLCEMDNSSHLFDFVVDDSVKSVQIKQYHLQGGAWVEDENLFCGSEIGKSGRIAISYKDVLPRRPHVAVQSEDGLNVISPRSKVKIPKHQAMSLSEITSKTEITYDTEIPLLVQCLADGNTVTVNSFFDLDRYTDKDYTAVYAVTATFSRSRS